MPRVLVLYPPIVTDPGRLNPGAIVEQTVRKLLFHSLSSGQCGVHLLDVSVLSTNICWEHTGGKYEKYLNLWMQTVFYALCTCKY